LYGAPLCRAIAAAARRDDERASDPGTHSAVALRRRVSLPSVIRYAIVSQASRALHTDVTVGLVGLSLWNGSVRIQDLAIHVPPGDTQETLIGWKMLQVTLGYRDLFHKILRVREIVLDTPRIALDRLADGQLNLQRVPPAPESASAPEAANPAAGAPAAAAAVVSAWGFALDRFVLRGGGARFRDLLVPESQPLAIDVPSVEVADVSFQPGVYAARR
jgi:uncharacterized protein involved in outer membrane biogenesis